MRSALAKWMDVDFDGVPLHQAVRNLSQQAGVSIVLDEECLANAKASKDAPVTLHLKRVRLGSILEIILDSRNLAADFRPDVVVVLDKDGVKKTYVQKVYPVADLV